MPMNGAPIDAQFLRCQTDISKNGFVCGIMTTPSGKVFSYLWEIHLQLTIPCIRKTNGRFGYYGGRVKSSKVKFIIDDKKPTKIE